MCDEVEGSAMYSRKRRRARKHYRCEACGETIAAGAHYVAHKGFDDEWWTIRQCERCNAITSAIQARTTGAVELHLDCGDTWADVFGACPPEVQDLAFELPGERGQS